MKPTQPTEPVRPLAQETCVVIHGRNQVVTIVTDADEHDGYFRFGKAGRRGDGDERNSRR